MSDAPKRIWISKVPPQVPLDYLDERPEEPTFDPGKFIEYVRADQLAAKDAKIAELETLLKYSQREHAREVAKDHYSHD